MTFREDVLDSIDKSYKVYKIEIEKNNKVHGMSATNYVVYYYKNGINMRLDLSLNDTLKVTPEHLASIIMSHIRGN